MSAGDVQVTIVGNLTADVDLKWTQSGAAVASFTVASTPRTFDKDSNQWRDGDPLFLRCSVWRQYAENCAESLQKGMQVMVQGRLKQRSYENKDGQKITVTELDVEDVGPTLRFATAKVTKSQRGNGGGSSNGAQSGGNWGSNGQQGNVQRSGGQGQRGAQQQEPDPWATTAGARAGGYADEAPF